MFSSFLPTASSSMKFQQNGSSKASNNRFSVRVFRAPSTAPLPYALNPKFIDAAYRSAPQPEQQPTNWYPTNSTINASYGPNASYAPSTRANYAIYPSTTNDTYIYEQSICSRSDLCSNSEFDSAFSPAMSTDSTMTLKSPMGPEVPLEESSRITRSATPAIRSYAPQVPSALQGPVMARTPSTNRPVHEVPMESADDRRAKVTSLQTQLAPSGNFVMQLPEYAESTFSELDVDERHDIAKMNAEYNAASSAGFYPTATGSSGHGSSPPNSSSFTRVATSQPLHPNLHFPVKLEVTYQPHAGVGAPVSHNSPPSVERIPSQLPASHVPTAQSQATYFTTSSQGDNWSNEKAYNSDGTSKTSNHRTSPQNAYSHQGNSSNSSRSPPTIYASNGVQETSVKTAEQRQDPPRSLSRQQSLADRRSSSFAGTHGSRTGSSSDSQTYGVPHGGSDYHQHDSTLLTLASATLDSTRRATEPAAGPIPRDYPLMYANSSELRHGHDTHSSTSPLRDGSAQVSSKDMATRAAAASELRRDARTPASRDRDRDSSEERYHPSYPSRRDSYIYATPEAQPRSSKETRSRSDFVAGSLSSSPKQMRVTPDEFDAAPTSNYPLQTFQADRVRTTSISFSSSSRPTLPTTTSSQTQTSSSAYHESSSRATSEYDRERRGHTSNISENPFLARSSEYTNSHAPTEADRRTDTRGAHTSADTNAYNTQIPPTSLSSRVREAPIQAQPSRQAATVQTASSTSSSRSSDSHHSRKTEQFPPALGPDTRTSYFEPVPPQVQVPFHHPDPSPLRRQSDGDRPHDTSSILPHSSAGRQDPQYEPLFSSSSSSSSSTSSNGNSKPIQPMHPPFPEPQRRYSDGDQNAPPVRPTLTARNSAPLGRSVRWTENLVAPSPILANQKRKGWFNRRGDQLWTNEGAYKPPAPGQDYPPDLDDYPEHGEGWMNEECVRIDMGHRLIPKTPLRSALKMCTTKA